MLSRGMGMGRAYDNCETCRMYLLRLVAMSGSDNDLELTAGLELWNEHLLIWHGRRVANSDFIRHLAARHEPAGFHRYCSAGSLFQLMDRLHRLILSLSVDSASYVSL